MNLFKKKTGFTLVELMIVIAIIAIIAAIAIPAILSARRSSNESSVIANLKSFTTAMTTYAQNQDDQSYPESADVFGNYYSHIMTKGGYRYSYLTNLSATQQSMNFQKFSEHIFFFLYPVPVGFGTAPAPEPEENTPKASKYIYIAAPESLSNGRRAFFAEESGQIWELSLEGVYGEGYDVDELESMLGPMTYWALNGAKRIGGGSIPWEPISGN